jgi:hypothetical protein
MAKSLLTVTLDIPDEDADTLADKIGIAQTNPEGHLVWAGLRELFKRGATLKPVQLGVAVDEYTATPSSNDPVTVVLTVDTHGNLANTETFYVGGQQFVAATSASADFEVTLGSNADDFVTNLAAEATLRLAAGEVLYGILTSATASTADDTVTFVFASPGAAGEFMVNLDQTGGLSFDVDNLSAVTTRTRKYGWKLVT